MSVKLSAKKVLKLFFEQKGRCKYCNCNFSLDELPTADHIIPRSDPLTSNNIKNICLSCEKCNLLKWEKSLDEFNNYKEIF